MDLTMWAEMLKAPLVNKKFVIGESDCNYEIYLRELINQSVWFDKHYPGNFAGPSTESHGENDAINENYQLDFKLFAAPTALRARNLLSPQVYKITEGITLFGGSKEKNIKLNATRLFAAFRGKTLDELYQLRSTDTINYSVENDIVCMLKVLETQKNILLFFPYVFSFDDHIDNSEAISCIVEALNSDFENALIYRENKAQGFDTFLTCLYDSHFLLLRVIEHKLRLCDQVSEKLVPTYCRLTEYCDMY